jgi:hypothetical protein
MERIPPPEPRRDKDALRQIAGSAPHGPGLRPSGRGVLGSCGCAERLHRARHPRHEGRGISLSGDRGSPAVSRFAQQSLVDGSLSTKVSLAIWFDRNNKWVRFEIDLLHE